MFSWISNASSKNNYEKILFDLESKIKAQVDALAKEQKQEDFYNNSINSLFKVYLVCMVGIIVYSGLYKLETINIVIAITVPLILEAARKIVDFFYALKKKRLESKLEKTRLYQLEKIEELKSKTAYYTTKDLIERYETPLKKIDSISDLTAQAGNHVKGPGTPLGTTPLGIHGAGSNPLGNQVGQTEIRTPLGGMPALELNDVKEEDNLDLRKTASSSSVGILMSPSRSWVDRLLDKIIGDPGQFSKYALICEFCNSHNGLVAPESFSRQNFRCFRCDKFNLSKEARFKNLSQRFIEKDSPIRSINGTIASNLSDLSNESNGSKQNPKKENGIGKENESNGSRENESQGGTEDECNGIMESSRENEIYRESKKGNGAATPPSGGSDVEKKKSSSKLKKRTNKKLN